MPTESLSAGLLQETLTGGIQVARQKIQVGMTHAGKIVTVVTGNHSFRLVIDGETVAVVPRATSREIARYKACATRPGRR